MASRRMKPAQSVSSSSMARPRRFFPLTRGLVSPFGAAMRLRNSRSIVSQRGVLTPSIKREDAPGSTAAVGHTVRNAS